MMRVSPLLSLAAIGLAAAALNGCATLSQEQCVAGDWYGIGYQDGAQGYSYARLGEHTEACASHGITPDPAPYETGRQQGLLRYCTAPNGFRAGRQGSAYRGVCPADVEPDFLAGYSDGQLVHAAQQAYDNAYNASVTADSRARSLETEIRNEENRLGAQETTDEERQAIRERLRRLRNDRERALDEAEQARREARWAESEAANLRARFSAYYGSW